MSVPARRTIGGGQALGVGLASFYSAAVAYVVLLIAAHRLQAADNAIFLAFWAILFGGFGVVTGVAAEAARSTFDGQLADERAGAPIIPIGVTYGAGVAILASLSAPLWGPQALGQRWPLILVAATACVAFSGHLALSGVLTGLQRWRGVAALSAGEATARLVAVLVALALRGTLIALAVASAVSAGAWLCTLTRVRVRRHLRRRSDLTARVLLHHYASASSASAASAALTVGFPVLISLTSTKSEFLTSAGLLLGISLTRAPLLVPLTAYQGVVLAHFLSHRERGARAVLPVLGVVLGVTAAASAGALLLGARVYRLMLGGRYVLSGPMLAALVVTAGLLAVQTVTGMCCLALGQQRAYAAGWIASTGTAVVVLLGPWGLDTRVLASLLVAPLAGAALHLAVLSRSHPAPSHPTLGATLDQ